MCVQIVCFDGERAHFYLYPSWLVYVLSHTRARRLQKRRLISNATRTHTSLAPTHSHTHTHNNTHTHTHIRTYPTDEPIRDALSKFSGDHTHNRHTHTHTRSSSSCLTHKLIAGLCSGAIAAAVFNPTVCFLSLSSLHDSCVVRVCVVCVCMCVCFFFFLGVGTVTAAVSRHMVWCLCVLCVLCVCVSWSGVCVCVYVCF